VGGGGAEWIREGARAAMNIAPFPGASSGAGGHGLLRDAACATGGSSPFLAPPAAAAVPVPNKRKRRPAGTPGTPPLALAGSAIPTPATDCALVRSRIDQEPG
jgi:hypothetical protein